MPALRFIVPATTTDAMSNRKFNIIPAGGAILNVWAAAVTVTDTWGLSVGDRDLIVDGSNANVVIAAGVVDVDRDQVLFNEEVDGGQIFLPATLTTDMNFLIHIRYL